MTYAEKQQPETSENPVTRLTRKIAMEEVMIKTLSEAPRTAANKQQLAESRYRLLQHQYELRQIQHNYGENDEQS